MSDKLEAYLEEISHFLSGKDERQEILSEIRSHILEKAAEGAAAVEGTAEAAPDDAAIERAIADFGPARRVAERYLDESRPIIAPAYKRYLFRYTSLLFVFHVFLAIVAVVFKKDFVIFPFLFIPRLNVFSAVVYLPTAFLADLGIVTLILYFITQSGKDIPLPWPKIAVDLDEVKPPTSKLLWERIFTGIGAVIMLAVTDFAVYLFVRHQTIFFVNLNWHDPRPLLLPGPGRRLSLIVIAMLATSTMSLFVKLFTRSRWVDIASNAVWLGLIGLLLTQPWQDLFAVPVAEALLRKLRFVVTFTLLFMAVITTIELVKHIVVLSRRKLTSIR